MSLRQLTPLGGRRPVDPVDRAFDRFYRDHVAEVYQYALAVLTNPADAEDVTQATFLNAYRAFQRGERPRIPHNWLIKIAHNVCRMRWRQAKRRPQEVPLELVREPMVVDDEDKPSVDDVLRALSILPFNQRAAIVMREVEGRSYGEIAEILGTTLPAVEALLFRARQRLRMRRDAIGVLSTAPVPASLTTFFGGGGSVVGGSVLASSVALKAAAVVATGIVAGTLGFRSVHAIADPPTSGAAVRAPTSDSEPRWANPVQRLITARERANLAERARADGSNAPTARIDGRPVDGTQQLQQVTLIPGSGVSTPTSGSPGGGVGDAVTTVSSSLPVPLPTPPISTPPLPKPPPLPVPVPPPPVTLPTVTVPPLPK
jgi:RNA polymerase sigma factor (sigma-70 family)